MPVSNEMPHKKAGQLTLMGLRLVSVLKSRPQESRADQPKSAGKCINEAQGEMLSREVNLSSFSPLLALGTCSNNSFDASGSNNRSFEPIRLALAFSVIVAEAGKLPCEARLARVSAASISVMQNHRQRALLVLIFGEHGPSHRCIFTCTCFLAVARHVAGVATSWAFVPAPDPPAAFAPCFSLSAAVASNRRQMNSTQKAGAMPTIRPPRQSNGPPSSGLRRSRSAVSSSSLSTAFICKMLFHGLLLALAFYAGIVVGMTHVHASGAAGHAVAADCPPCAAADTAPKSGVSDAQIESIVDKRVEVGES